MREQDCDSGILHGVAEGQAHESNKSDPKSTDLLGRASCLAAGCGYKVERLGNGNFREAGACALCAALGHM